MPVGCVGELVVESPLVSSGYINDWERTQESFVTDPAWVRLVGALQDTECITLAIWLGTIPTAP